MAEQDEKIEGIARWLYDWSQESWIKADPDIFAWENISESDKDHYRESARDLVMKCGI